MRYQRGLLVACIAGMVGCSDQSELAGPARAPESPEASAAAPGLAAAQLTRGPRGIESEFLQIETRVPGFGGFYVDEAGDIVGYVTDLRRAPAARAAVAEMLARDPGRFRKRDGSEPAIRLRRGDFSMSQLVEWQTRILRSHSVRDGISLLDADEMRNRVRVGIRDESLIPEVERLADRLGIPRSALVFETRRGDLVALASLRDTFRPTGAGIQIDFTPSTPGGECTMGFNVRTGTSDPDRYFLTAGHCTGNYNGPTGRVVYQPVSSRVGVEAYNPAWSTQGCRPGANYCRQTDAALIRYDSHITSQNRVAETTTIGTGNGWGNLTVARWYSVGSTRDPAQGSEVHKTGRTTGTTRGLVTGTCVNPGVAVPDYTEVFCSHEAQMAAAGGDSGSPVYQWFVPLTTTSRGVGGILWGGYIPGPGETARIYYSPISLLQADFGFPWLGPW